MNVMILKITDPHGWVIADKIVEKYPTFLKVAYGEEQYTDYLCVPPQVSLEELSHGIEYWLEKASPQKEHLLVLTDNTEDDNYSLIQMLRNLQSEKTCIIICNDYMNQYYSKKGYKHFECDCCGQKYYAEGSLKWDDFCGIHCMIAKCPNCGTENEIVDCYWR